MSNSIILGYSDRMLLPSYLTYQLRTKRRSYRIDRLRLWESQNHFCYWCKRLCIIDGLGNNPIQFTVDHVIPLCRGGTNHWMNLIGSCYRCNAGRELRWNKIHVISLKKVKR